MNAKLSLLITYYDEGEILTECVDSLLMSTMLPDEILIYDDCSPRPAVDFVVPHPKVRVIRGETNRGVEYARNHLLHEAQGEYARYHDADDLFVPEWCEEIMRAIEDNPGVDLIINNWQIHKTIGQETIETVLGRHDFDEFDKAGRDTIRHFIRYGVNTPSITFRRTMALDMGGYETPALTLGEDRYFGIRIAVEARTSYLIDKPLVIIRQRSDGASKSRDEDGNPRTQQHARDRQRFYPSILQNLPDEYHLELALMALMESTWYFRQGFKHEAKKIFEFAHGVGGDALFSHFSLTWRVLIRVFGYWRTRELVHTAKRILKSASASG